MGRLRVEGEVVRSRCGEQYCASEIEAATATPVGGIEAATATPVGGGDSVTGLRLRAWSKHGWVAGERVLARMGVGPPVEYRNPGLSTAFEGVRLPGGRVWAVRVEQPAPLRRALESLRAHVRQRLVAHTAPGPAGIARALVLGESGAIDDGAREQVRGAGLAHLVAVSGLHMALLAGFWQRLGSGLARRTPLVARWPAERVGAALGLGMLLPTVLFVGAAPSALRAGLTAALGWGLILLGRRPDPAGVGGTTVLLCLAFDPGLCRRPAFLLSVAATAALLRPGRSDLEPGAALRPSLAGLRDSARTWAATLPLGLACFGTSSPWALVSNLFGVPFAALCWVPLALVHALSASLHGGLAGLTAPGFEVACGALLWACAQLPALPGASPGAPVGPWAFALLCLGAAVALWGGRGRARWWLVGAALVGALVSQRLSRPWPDPGEVEVTFLDVGQGDAAVVRTGEGQVALIDVGGRLHGAGPDPGQRAVVPWLRAHGVERIDLLVLSHPHPDHVGGLPAVLDAFAVEEIWDTGQAEDEQPEGTLAAWLARARTEGTRVRGPRSLCGGQPRLGPAKLRVLGPCPAHDPGHGPNDNSFVVELRHGERRFLFAGDAERAQESRLLAGGDLDPVDVLKVGHHGSRTSSHADFLAALSPDIAVVSCGRHNTFGHPHDAALTRLKAAVPHVLRLDRLGGVQVVSDGRRLRVRAHDPGLQLQVPQGR